MLPYIILVVVPLLFCMVAVRRERKKLLFIRGSSDYIRSNSLAITVFFLLFFVLLSLRDASIGRDIIRYQYRFNSYSSMPLSEVFLADTDPLYSLLNWVVMQVTDNFQIFLAIVSVVILYPVFLIYSEDRRYSYLKIILFVNLTPYVLIFSGLRQSIAMAIGMIAYHFVRKKKLVPFLLVTFVAIGFHHSAFMIFAMYPLYYATLKKKHLFFIIPVIIAVFIFNKPIFSYLVDFLSVFSDEYSDVTLSETGAVGTLVLFIGFAFISYFLPDEKQMDRELIGLRNFLLLTVVLQCFAPIHTLAMRLNYYYILFIPIIIPKIMAVRRQAYAKIALWANRIMLAYFIFLYFDTLVTSYTTNISALDTIPYKFFWQ